MSPPKTGVEGREVTEILRRLSSPFGKGRQSNRAVVKVK
jgi:hypothetical protein